MHEPEQLAEASPSSREKSISEKNDELISKLESRPFPEPWEEERFNTLLKGRDPKDEAKETQLQQDLQSLQDSIQMDAWLIPALRDRFDWMERNGYSTDAATFRDRLEALLSQRDTKDPRSEPRLLLDLDALDLDMQGVMEEVRVAEKFRKIEAKIEGLDADQRSPFTQRFEALKQGYTVSKKLNEQALRMLAGEIRKRGFDELDGIIQRYRMDVKKFTEKLPTEVRRMSENHLQHHVIPGLPVLTEDVSRSDAQVSYGEATIDRLANGSYRVQLGVIYKIDHVFSIPGGEDMPIGGEKTATASMDLLGDFNGAVRVVSKATAKKVGAQDYSISAGIEPFVVKGPQLSGMFQKREKPEYHEVDWESPNGEWQDYDSTGVSRSDVEKSPRRPVKKVLKSPDEKTLRAFLERVQTGEVNCLKVTFLQKNRGERNDFTVLRTSTGKLDLWAYHHNSKGSVIVDTQVKEPKKALALYKDYQRRVKKLG